MPLGSANTSNRPCTRSTLPPSPYCASDRTLAFVDYMTRGLSRDRGMPLGPQAAPEAELTAPEDRGRRQLRHSEPAKMILPSEPAEACPPRTVQKGRPHLQNSRSCSASAFCMGMGQPLAESRSPRPQASPRVGSPRSSGREGFYLDHPAAAVATQRAFPYMKPVFLPNAFCGGASSANEDQDFPAAGICSSVMDMRGSSSHRAVPSSASAPPRSDLINQATSSIRNMSPRGAAAAEGSQPSSARNTRRRTEAARHLFGPNESKDTSPHPSRSWRRPIGAQPLLPPPPRLDSLPHDRRHGNRRSGSASPRVPISPVLQSQARELPRMRSSGPLDAPHRSSSNLWSTFNRFGRELPPAPSRWDPAAAAAVSASPRTEQVHQQSSQVRELLRRPPSSGGDVRQDCQEPSMLGMSSPRSPRAKPVLDSSAAGQPSSLVREPRSSSPSLRKEGRRRLPGSRMVKVEDKFNDDIVWVDSQVLAEAEGLQLRRGNKIHMNTLSHNDRPDAPTSFRSLSPPDIRSVGKAIAESNMRLRESLYQSLLAQSPRHSRGSKWDNKRHSSRRGSQSTLGRSSSLGRQQSTAASANSSVAAFSANMSSVGSISDTKIIDSPPTYQMVCPPDNAKHMKEVQLPLPLPQEDGGIATPSTDIGTPGTVGRERSTAGSAGS